MAIDLTLPSRPEANVAREAIMRCRDFARYCTNAAANARTSAQSANAVVETIDICRDVLQAITTLQGDAAATAEAAYMLNATNGETNQKFTDVASAVVAIRDWCINALPKDVDGNLAIHKRDAQGAQSVYRFELGTLDALANLMDAYVTAAKA